MDELEQLEFGRYRLWKTLDGGWLLARAAGTCERCQGCGCGTQQDQVVVPGMLVRMAEAMQKDGTGIPLSPMAMIRRLRRGRSDRADDSESGGDGAEAPQDDDLPGDLVDLVPAVGSSDQESDS